MTVLLGRLKSKESNRSYSTNVSKEADDRSAILFILLFLIASDSCTSKMVIDHYESINQAILNSIYLK